jgi:hypothetical protein
MAGSGAHVSRTPLKEGRNMVADIIRKADSEAEVYFYLTSYIEAARSCNTCHCLPEQVARLPLSGVGDLRARFSKLVLELDAASRQLDNDSCATIRESLHVIATALDRLHTLHGPLSADNPSSAEGKHANASIMREGRAKPH